MGRRTASILLFLSAVAGFLVTSTDAVRAEDAGRASDEPDAATTDTADIDWSPTVAGANTQDQPTDPVPQSGNADGRKEAGPVDIEPPTTGTDFGSMLIEMLLVLAAVCLLAYAVLRWGVGKLVGGDTTSDGPIEILERQPLGPDRSIVVVRIGSKTLVVGSSEAGMTRLGELDGEDLEEFLEERRDNDDNETASPLTSLWRLGDK
mgnify:CR=1 FL=1